jgi:NADH-quinone oxidoreductase subunit G
MAEMVPHLARLDQVTPAPWTGSGADAGGGQFDKAPFVSAVANYYETNPITRASSVMRQCTEEITRQGGQQGGGATGTHG